MKKDDRPWADKRPSAIEGIGGAMDLRPKWPNNDG